MEIHAAEGGLEQSVEQGVALGFAARLAAIEARLEELAALCVSAGAARSEPAAGARKTLPVEMATLLAKQGVSLEQTLGSLEAGALSGALGGALDQALMPLSIEQRIAVKAQLMRAGLMG